MNLNIIAYAIYIILMGILIVKVGFICYKNGNVYVGNMMPNTLELCLRINKILLLGYYLVNIGYSLYAISTWETIFTPPQVISEIARHSSKLILILALLHYINMAGIHFLINYLGASPRGMIRKNKF